MKMENIIRTDHDVTIEKIFFNEGEPVGIGQMIMKFSEQNNEK
jgi:biotin carboxyl carrier protein